MWARDKIERDKRDKEYKAIIRSKHNKHEATAVRGSAKQRGYRRPQLAIAVGNQRDQ